MKNKFYIIFNILLLILLFFLGKQCNSSPKNDLKPFTDTIIYHRIDTIKDTITIFKSKIKTVFNPIEVYKYITDSSYSNIRQYRVYKDTLRDSNIVIITNDTILGYLDTRQISYRLLVPLRIYDSTRTTINKNIPSLPKYQLKVGIMSTYNSIIPNVDLSIRRNNYTLGYDPFNKTPIIGYKYTIWYK